MKPSLFLYLIWSYNLPLLNACAATSASTGPNHDHTTAAPHLCGTMCKELTVKRDDDGSQPVTQTPVENAGNGCSGFTQTCNGLANDAAVVFTWYDENGMDVGSTFGTAMATATLACGPDNKLTFNGTKVDQVECISA